MEIKCGFQILKELTCSFQIKLRRSMTYGLLETTSSVKYLDTYKTSAEKPGQPIQTHLIYIVITMSSVTTP